MLGFLADRIDCGVETLPDEIIQFLESVQVVMNKTQYGIKTY